MQALPLVALALAALVLGAAAWRLWPGLPPRGRRALLAGGALAVPLAWLAVLALADRLLAWAAPVDARAHLALVLAALGALAALQLGALLLPERHVWAAVAVVPVAAIVVGSVEPDTRMGGPLAGVLALVLLMAAAVLPRGLALAASDRSRAFVALVAALSLALGGVFGAALGVAAVREGGLGLAEAERAWRLEVAPEDDAPYALLVPFPVAEEGRAREVAERWIAAARVVEGDGRVEVVEPGVLRVTGVGPLVAEAQYAFRGPAGLREDVAAFVAPSVASRAEDEARPVEVTWRATASADGAPCASREVRATLGPEPIFAERAPVWPDASCALI